METKQSCVLESEDEDDDDCCGSALKEVVKKAKGLERGMEVQEGDASVLTIVPNTGFGMD